MRTLDGAVFAPFAVPPSGIRVFVFATVECPIANAYAPKLAELHEEWRSTGVELVVVLVDPELSENEARAHARDYGLSMPIVLDREQRLAGSVGATVTPEAAVYTRSGLAYLGRIDDRWRARGADGQTAEHEDLRLAVRALQAGQEVAHPRRPAVGCRLPTR